MAAKIGFVGLGVMGGPMAGHIASKGFDLTVWNRTKSKSEPLRQAGAQIAPSLEALGATSDVVFLCVNRSEDVADCVRALAKHARAGSLFVDHSTIAPSAAQELHRSLAGMGLRFLDAPITGGSMGAQKGQLTIFCGGSRSDFDDAMIYMASYAKRAELVGGPGAGQMMKMANQIAVGGALLGLCECLSFATKAGLDLAQTRDMVGGGAGGSWAFDNYGPKILHRDWSPGFSIKNQRKDFGYCRDAAEQLDAAIPGTDLVDTLLGRAADQEWTTAALYEILLQMGAIG